MRGERETYEQIGEVAGWVHDLGAAWAEEAERTRVVVAERDVGYAVERLLPAPLELVWTYVTDPSLRPLWQAGVTSVEELPTAARRGVGSTNHCVHGTDVLVEEILDWRPTEYLTLRTTLPDGFKLLGTYAFEDDPDGTRARLRFTWGRNRREREELGVVRGMLDQTLSTGLARLDEVLREAVAERASEAISAGPEPELPENRQRELAVPTTEPPAE